MDWNQQLILAQTLNRKLNPKIRFAIKLMRRALYDARLLFNQM